MVSLADASRGVRRIELSRPDITEEDISAVVRVLRSGHLVQGPEVARLERVFAQLVGSRHAVAVSNGTASLHLALIALGIGPGDEVIVPAFSYIATANVVERVGARCVFVDVEPGIFNVGPEGVEAAITPRSRAIVPVHEFGLACDIARIAEIGRRRGIPVIEDAACALGALRGRRHVGSVGEVGSFSLHPRKAVTSGEGGMLTTDDDALATQFRILRNHGIDERREFVAAGLNCRMTDFQAALVHGQLTRLDAILDRRAELASVYRHELGAAGWLELPKVPEGCRHSWQTFHALLSDTIDRDGVIQALAERGIGANYGAQCIPAQPYFRDRYRLDSESLFANAYGAWRHGLALPLHSAMSRQDVVQVATQLTEVVGTFL